MNFVDPLGLLATRPGAGEAVEPYVPRNPYDDAREMEKRAPGLPSPVGPTPYERVAGAEMVGLGSMITGAGGVALTGSGSTGVAATGLTAGGVIGGGGAIILGAGIIAIGIDLIEGQGLDKTMNTLNWLIGAE